MHPANGGRLCARSSALDDMLDLDQRLLRPMVDGNSTSWDRAIDQAARRLTDSLARHGPESVALHVPGTLLTEDYYAANKLMKGFIGSANISASWSGTDGLAAAQRAAFGEDVMPGAYEDVERADMLLLVGASALRRHPVLHERIAAAQEARGTRVILLAHGDEGSDIGADIRLSIAPGSEAALLSGLLLHCHDAGLLDPDFLQAHVAVPRHFWTGLRRGHDLWSVARACRLEPGEVRAFYEAFIMPARFVTLFSPDDGAVGSRRLSSAILNLHLATGRIGKPGSTPFAIGGAPNGMGGREVGCHAGEIAAHQDFSADAIARVGRFWGAPLMAEQPGLSGPALVDAIADGRIKSLLLLGGLPPAAHPIRAMLDRVPLIILSTPWMEPEMTSLRMIAMPSPVWIEKDGTLTGADRLISRQRHLLPLPGKAKPDWWIVTQIARAMGWHDAFHYERPAEIYREHARLTAYGNDGARLLDLRRHASISNPAYDELTPWRWGEVPFDEGRFPTPDRRAQLVPVWD